MSTSSIPKRVPVALDDLLLQSATEALLLHGPNGSVHFTTPSASELLGSTLSIGDSLLDFFEPSDVQPITAGFRNAVVRGSQTATRTVKVGQKYLVVSTLPIRDRMGGVAELQTTLKDVTAFVELRERIQLQENIANAAAELASVGGWLYDAHTNLLHWSPMVRMLHGVPEDYVPNVEEAIRFYHKDHRQSIEDAVRLALEQGVRSDLECALHPQTGGVIWVRVSLVAENPGAPSQRIYGAFQDITELHRRQAHLARTVELVTQQRDRLEEFAYVISHHLRGPVSSLLTLMNHNTGNVVDGEQLTLLRETAQSLLDTFEDLTHAISVHHVEMPNIETINVAEIVASLSADMAGRLRACNGTVTIDNDSLEFVTYPRVYLETVIRQLLDNSCRYAEPTRPLRVRFRIYLEQGRPMLEIRDNGLGIDLERYGSKLFKLRSTLHRGPATRGMGLFLVRSIIETMGGSVQINSTVDVGTTFMVDLTANTFLLPT